VSPMRRADYPRDWKQKAAAIKFGRAHGRCECRGECGVRHDGRCEARHGQPHPITSKVVWLQTAHLDRNTRNNDPANLRAMCPRCHVRYDSGQHRANAAWTRAGRPDVQLELFSVGSAA
jgi:hypothetical protein